MKLISGYKFNVSFDLEDVPDLLVDERKPIGESAGPSPSRLLSTAVGHCLSSSLLFCLRKSRVKIEGLETIVKTNVERNQDGRLRITLLDVRIRLKTNEGERSRVDRCLSLFEDYCTVTQSVRKGIEVKVTME